MRVRSMADATTFTERPGPGDRELLPAVHSLTASGARNLPLPATPDLFRPETRAERKTRLFAAAKRWAERLPFESGDDHRRTYERLISNLLGALRA